MAGLVLKHNSDFREPGTEEQRQQRQQQQQRGASSARLRANPPKQRESYNCKACKLYSPSSTGWGKQTAATPGFKLPVGYGNPKLG
ncbi:hypothetical protein E2C01_090549 [Portunus trituberculatus]|uniref:Uncharacterized protein n=1 Tax=Portunus trituberculatus TaxID=210409 RepID=A0A5B7JGV8_PORTR|nr:hypothetical protein [Portunus trituberculatus]